VRMTTEHRGDPALFLLTHSVNPEAPDTRGTHPSANIPLEWLMRCLHDFGGGSTLCALFLRVINGGIAVVRVNRHHARSSSALRLCLACTESCDESRETPSQCANSHFIVAMSQSVWPHFCDVGSSMLGTTAHTSVDSQQHFSKSTSRTHVDNIAHWDERVEGRQIDADPSLLDASYRLRYQVYCLERRFLKPDDYPDHVEQDEFDRHSVHLGVVNHDGELLATARLVQPSMVGLPLFRHCQIFPQETELFCETNRTVEISRLCISRNLKRRGRTAAVVALYRALYQASKRNGWSHWVVATEPSLQRLVAMFAAPFRAIGPLIDYYGQVAPYLVDLQAWDDVILSDTQPVLHSFLEGLEPEFRPMPSEGYALA
jgi:N-acyl-L-homoserine lactone synthetase